MGYILRLPSAGSASLPTLGDIGYVSQQNLLGLYLIDGGTGLTDSSGNGADLSLLNGTVTPPYSSGVLQFRGVTNGQQQMTTGVPIVGRNCTMIACYRKNQSNPVSGHVIAGHAGAILGGSTAGPMTLWDDASNFQLWGQQSKRPSVEHSPTGQNVGQWNVLAGTRNATGISLSINGQTPVTVAYDTEPSVTTSNNVVLGDVTAGTRFMDGDLGFFAFYNRTLGAAELASTYKAIRRLMAAKGYVI